MALKIIGIVSEFDFSRNKAKNAGRSRKNVGRKAKCGIMVDTYMYVGGSCDILFIIMMMIILRLMGEGSYPNYDIQTVIAHRLCLVHSSFVTPILLAHVRFTSPSNCTCR